MVRKIFALASVSALACILTAVGIAGCSDSTPEVAPDAGPDVSQPDAKKPQPEAGDEPDTGSPESCMTKTDVDTSVIPYKKARVQPSTCTEADSKALRDYIENLSGAVDVAAWKAKVGATCAACVFSDGKAESWSPIILDGNKVGIVNAGGCIEAVSGNTNCGAAYQRWVECSTEACKECSSQSEFDACKKNTSAINKGPCKPALLKVQSECGADINTYESTCFPDTTKYYFEGSVNHLCVAPPKDGGP